VVGLAIVAQQIPFAVMVPPPSLVIFPPDIAVVCVIEVTAVVVKVGITIEGVTEFEGELGRLLPLAFVATTVKV
jgi:hypothetical protein